jgi:hypothetical protein
MTVNDVPTAGPNPHVNFDAPATLRKWPSRNNERLDAAPAPYLIAEHTLDECIRQFMAKPVSARHLYEIHTTPQPVGGCRIEIVAELARLRDFL